MTVISQMIISQLELGPPVVIFVRFNSYGAVINGVVYVFFDPEIY